MSYTPPAPTGDTLNDYFSRLNDFMNIAPNLLKASSVQSFEVWYEKLELIDRRALFLYIKEHSSEIPAEYKSRVKNRVPEEYLYG